jgi:hypothetical protein
MKNPLKVLKVLEDAAHDAGLGRTNTFHLGFLPNYRITETVEEIGRRFQDFVNNWVSDEGNISLTNAPASDLMNLWPAASRQMLSGRRIVIFGHTHDAMMMKERDPDREFRDLDKGIPPWEIPVFRIYANSGSWVDAKATSEQKGTYVETEVVEIGYERRLYVRVKGYPQNSVIEEGFVLI